MGLRPCPPKPPRPDCVIAPGLAAVIEPFHRGAAGWRHYWRVLTMPSLSFFVVPWLALSAFVFAGAAQGKAVADPLAELGALTQRWLDDALTRNQAPAPRCAWR